MDKKPDLSNKKLFLMDMDGTIYLDDRLLPGAREFIERTRERGRAVIKRHLLKLTHYTIQLYNTRRLFFGQIRRRR